MILSVNYEELRALATGAELLLSGHEQHPDAPPAASAEALGRVERLLPRLGGTFEIDTLAEQRDVRGAVSTISDFLHSRMDSKVLEHHPAHEEAVSFYFDYAHTLAVLGRLDEMGTEMRAIIELTTGHPATPETAAGFVFPD
jgi:hypothetical protein